MSSLVGSGRVDVAIRAALAAAIVLVLGLVILNDLGDEEKERRFARLSPAAPVRLDLPDLSVKAKVVPIELSPEGVLDPPADPQQVGWWRGSARPGSRSGQTVLAGHTVHTGGGALDDVPTLRKGGTVDVATGEGLMRYRITGLRTLSRDGLAQHAQSLFGQDRGKGRLVIVTCTDWNGTVFESNAIVLAKPLGKPVKHTKQAAPESLTTS